MSSPSSPSSATATERPLSKSHFLALPAELRNMIYEALFQTRELKKLWMDTSTNADDSHQESDVLRCPIPGAVELVLTCRKLNKEAAGYLYSSCTFNITVDNIRPQGPISMFNDFLSGMMNSWLGSIGEQRALLSGLDIDLTALILDLAGQWRNFHLNIAAMLRHTYGVGKSNQVPISFSVRWEELEEQHRAGLDQDPRPHLERLNRMLQIAKTHRPLRTYLRCWRTVSAFHLTIDPPVLQVDLGLDYGYLAQCTRVLFDIGEDDQVMRRPLPPANLHRLLENRHIRKRILNTALRLEGTITIDFGKAKISQPFPGLLHTSRYLRTLVQQTYLSLNGFRFHATVEQSRLNRDDFEYLTNQQPNALLTWITGCWKLSSETMLFITFNVPDDTALQDIRIEVRNLIRKAVDLQFSRYEGHYLHLRHQATQEERRLNMNDVRRHFLAFLYNICVQCEHLRNMKLVSAWMDGEGHMAEAELSNENGDVKEVICSQSLAENWVAEENARYYRGKLRKMRRQEGGGLLLSSAVALASWMT